MRLSKILAGCIPVARIAAGKGNLGRAVSGLFARVLKPLRYFNWSMKRRKEVASLCLTMGAPLVGETSRWDVSAPYLLSIPNLFIGFGKHPGRVARIRTDPLGSYNDANSLCIDFTVRSAADKGFNVAMLSDCTAGRTNFEQEF